MRTKSIVIGEIKDFTYDKVKKGLQELDSAFDFDKAMYEYLKVEYYTYQDIGMDETINHYKAHRLDVGDIDEIIWVHTDYRLRHNNNNELIITRKAGK